MKQMKSLLEDPHGFSVSLVFDGILVGIFAGCISVIYRLLLNNAEKLLFAIIAFTKTRPFWIAVWFIALIIMGLIVGWIMSWEGMASGSGIPQVQGEMKGYLNQNWYRVLVLRSSVVPYVFLEVCLLDVKAHPYNLVPCLPKVFLKSLRNLQQKNVI